MTWRGVIARGLLRLAIATGILSGIALLVDHFKGGKTSTGFYLVGAAVLAIAFLTSAAGARGGYTTAVQSTRIGRNPSSQADREGRVSRSFAYILAGAIVVGIGIAIEALG